MKRWLWILAGCSHPALPFDEIRVDTPPGISDLTVDDRGRIWVIPERDREVDEVTLDGAVTHHPLDGAPGGDDTEGLAWLGGDRFAIGTEGAHAATAAVLYAELRAGRVVVTRTRPLTSDELGVTLTVNHGVEGVCGHGDDVLAAIETVGKLPDGTRYAPIAWLAGDALAITKLRLTTDTGKISAISCTIERSGSAGPRSDAERRGDTIDGDVAHAIAIERHYAVSRVLTFDLRRGAPEATPTVVYDLGPLLLNRLNLEGIGRLPDGRLIAVNDNQGATITGPTELIVFHPR